MPSCQFHQEPYDEGTLLKLRIFEAYAQAWIPVFLARPEPKFPEVHLFDYFSGPGSDPTGCPGSPLRLLRQLRDYADARLAGWERVKIQVHLSDADARKAETLAKVIDSESWRIPGVDIDVNAIPFQQALERHRSTLLNPKAAKLLIIDQFGVDAVKDDVFAQLTKFPCTDFIFFLSSSTLHRFRDHPAIKIKIEKPETSYDVHRVAFEWFRNLAPRRLFLGRFSIRKRSNIYGLIFGSQHPLGIHKFLEVAWSNDTIAGEANFDIERENVSRDELLLPFEELRPKKIQEFEVELEAALRAHKIGDEASLLYFYIEFGMCSSHAKGVLGRLKAEGVIQCDFRSPSIRNYRNPRPIRFASSPNP